MTTGAHASSTEEIARYYDRNTRRFLWLGSGRGVHSMHRELWGPGVASARDAADHINRVIADEIAALAVPQGARESPVIVDFGCGVGGTLFHLARRFPTARLKGITVSQRQVDIAERLAAELGFADRCSFSLGDFQSADLDVRADVVVAVESFAHSGSADAFLANAARHLRPRGALVVADDFLASEPDALNAHQRAWVDQFRSGWRVHALCTADRVVGAAAPHGLVAEKAVDLTPLTRPASRVRDRLTAAMGPLAAALGLGRMPFYGNLIGGNALQIGLREGFISYRLLTFRRTAGDCRDVGPELTMRRASPHGG
jgi:trans-aconitate methyltransferase